MKSSALSTSNSILRQKIRINPEVITELQQDPYPVLFTTFDEVRDWFESIRTDQINTRLRVKYSEEEFELYDAIRKIAKTGDLKLCERYQFPSPQSRQFIAFKLLVDYDFIVMVEREVWEELARILKKDKLHRILPKLTDYYYSFGHWDRHNKLLKVLEDKILDEDIKKRVANQFFKKLIEHRNEFKKDLENSFNFRNTLIYERAPFIYGLLLKDKYTNHYCTIKEKISDLIKTGQIANLKEKINNDVSFAMVLVERYYDLEKALLPDSGKLGMKWARPKEALAEYLLPIKSTFSEMRIYRPGYWTVRLLNSFVNTDAYSETRFDVAPLQTSDQALGQSYATRHGYVVHGEVQLNSDLERARKRALKA